MICSTKVLIKDDPYVKFAEQKDWESRAKWPCKWISWENSVQTPYVLAFRKVFFVDEDVTIRVHVSADERYELFLDGIRIGRGNERGDANSWHYESYDLYFTKGNHIIVAKVWALGDLAPYAQMTIRPGFLFSPEEAYLELLGTGTSAWQVKHLDGIDFTDMRDSMGWGTGARTIIDGRKYSWGFEIGEGDHWEEAQAGDYATNGLICSECAFVHRLSPAILPDMVERCIDSKVRFVTAMSSLSDPACLPIVEEDNIVEAVEKCNSFLNGHSSWEIPSQKCYRILLDLKNYYCVYPEIVVSGGKNSTITMCWAESLFEDQNVDLRGGSKGNRDQIWGKYFIGIGDSFKLDEGYHRKYETIWWRAGRYLEIIVRTEDEPVILENLILNETRYPLEMESSYTFEDAKLHSIGQIAFRTLQVCAHETYMDNPYWEQLMYVGDSRIQALVNYTVNCDERLPRKAIELFSSSIDHTGMTKSRYPCRVSQIIPPYSLWWIGMVYDYALWRGDKEFVRRMMPSVRFIIDHLLNLISDNGLLRAPNGWNFVDWVPSWKWGVPPDGETSFSSVINWQFILVLTYVRDLEQWIGEHELASRASWTIGKILPNIVTAFWDNEKAIFADDIAKTKFSEHVQCLAINSQVLSSKQNCDLLNSMLNNTNLSRTTIYFSHYLFEACFLTQRVDLLFDRLNIWSSHIERGLRTLCERPEPSRSDCHAWGAHILYHYFASILGIRPAAMGFEKITVRPQLGQLQKAVGQMIHPKGTISIRCWRENNNTKYDIKIPDRITIVN